jgi:hypothetical protein
MADSCTDATQDIPGRFKTVASSLRELADRLEKFDLPHDSTRLMSVSGELKQIGWNTLFVSSSIDKLINSAFQRSLRHNAQNRLDQLHQVDSLLVAVDYLGRTVQFLKSGNQDVREMHSDVTGAFLRLGERLQEVSNECKRS